MGCAESAGFRDDDAAFEQAALRNAPGNAWSELAAKQDGVRAERGGG